MPIFQQEDILVRLHPDAGLKIESTVVLGRAAITGFLKDNPDLVAGLDLEPWQGSKVLFGETLRNQNIKVAFSDGLINRIVISGKKTKKRRLVLVISYDGSDFFGFQTQKQERSVQAELEALVSRINDEPTSIQGASRTDAGVHALHQVIHFDTSHDFSSDRWVYILNKQLPKDIHVKSAAFAPPLFHSRYDADRKTYRYLINTGEYDPLMRKYEACYPRLATELIEADLASLIGTHDFASFCSGFKEDKTRTLYKAFLEKEGERLSLYFTGNGFLHHMVRLIVGQLVQIASGESTKDIRTILEERSRRSTRKLAPAGGLYLINVEY